MFNVIIVLVTLFIFVCCIHHALTAFTADVTFTVFTVLYYLAYGRSRP